MTFKSLLKPFGLFIIKNPSSMYFFAFLSMLLNFGGNALVAYLLGLVFGQALAFASVMLVATAIWYVFNINKLRYQIENDILKLQTLQSVAD